MLFRALLPILVLPGAVGVAAGVVRTAVVGAVVVAAADAVLVLLEIQVMGAMEATRGRMPRITVFRLQEEQTTL